MSRPATWLRPCATAVRVHLFPLNEVNSACGRWTYLKSREGIADDGRDRCGACRRSARSNEEPISGDAMTVEGGRVLPDKPDNGMAAVLVVLTS